MRMTRAMKNLHYLERIVKEAQEHIWHHPMVLSYLSARGVSDDQIKSLRLGFIPDEKWPAYVPPETTDEDEKFYLERTRKGYRLKGKVVFPLTNALGMVRAFQIRTPRADTKDYWKFYSLRSGVDALFFGTDVAMPHIWKSREVYLVEGIFDLFPVQRVFPNTLCCGTAEVSQDQIEFLKRHVDRVFVMFDHDEQGKRFFDQFYKDHRKTFDLIEKVDYSGKDPSDSWERLGEARFRDQFSRGLSLGLTGYVEATSSRGQTRRSYY
jgi:DNA primase